ncbi:unnamed protein product, partial [Chrysoparadoxa australica]
ALCRINPRFPSMGRKRRKKSQGSCSASASRSKPSNCSDDDGESEEASKVPWALPFALLNEKEMPEGSEAHSEDTREEKSPPSLPDARAAKGSMPRVQQLAKSSLSVFSMAPEKVVKMDGQTLLVGLCPGERLVIVGSARAACLRGEAQMLGHVLTPDDDQGDREDGATNEVVLHSFSWQSLLVVQSAESEGRHHQLKSGKLQAALEAVPASFPVVLMFRSVSSTREDSFLTAVDDGNAVYNRPSLDGQDKEDPPLYPKWMKKDESPEEEAALLHIDGMQIIVARLPPEPALDAIITKPDWLQAAQQVVDEASANQHRPFVTMVCGAKGVGKSTFCRYLLNKLLREFTSVAFLDCDTGQPEFTPPGMVSIHIITSPVLGPPHTHLKQPKLAFFQGAVTPKDEPCLYSHHIQKLVAWYRYNYCGAGEAGATGILGLSLGPKKPVPLVVSMDGWVKGLGAHLLSASIDTVQPDTIVQLQGSSAAKQLDLPVLPADTTVVTVAAPPHQRRAATPRLKQGPSAADLRTLRLMAYFVGDRHQHEGPALTSGPSIKNGSFHDKSGIICGWLTSQ